MKTMKLVTWLFLLVGAAMLIGAFLLYQNTTRFLETAVETEGVVIKLVGSDTYAPVVEFLTQDGRLVQFKSSTGSNPPSYSEGETVRVLYPPERPQRARIDGIFSLWGGSMILGGMGAVFFGTGLAVLLYFRRKERRKAQLTQRGIPVTTRYQEVIRNEMLSVNGRHPYQVLTQWLNPDTGDVHIFKSDNLFFDPSEYLTQDEIFVYMEPGNPRIYHMDLSFLPQLASS